MRVLFTIVGTLMVASAGSLVAQNTPAPAGNSGVGVVHLWPVQRNIYAAVGPGGNTTISIGDDGVLIVDTMIAEAAPDLVASIKTLSNKPIRWIVNTHSHRDHTGG